MKNLENKTLNENTEEFPGALVAHCKKCKEGKLFVYIGTQFHSFGNREPIYLYNCNECQSTRDSNTLTEKRIAPELDFEKLSDSEIVKFYAFHIENPCIVNVSGEEFNLRTSYINEAKKVLSKLSNPFAKSFLELTIGKYTAL